MSIPVAGMASWIPVLPRQEPSTPSGSPATRSVSHADEGALEKLKSILLNNSDAPKLETIAEICDSARLTIDILRKPQRSHNNNAMLANIRRARQVEKENHRLKQAAPREMVETRARELQQEHEDEIVRLRGALARKDEQIKALCEAVKNCDEVIDTLQLAMKEES